MQREYGLFYGGAFHPAGASGATPADVAAAVAAATEAFGTWRHLGPVERAAVLIRIAEIVDAHRQELGEIETRDTGRPIAETLFDVDAFRI